MLAIFGHISITWSRWFHYYFSVSKKHPYRKRLKFLITSPLTQKRLVVNTLFKRAKELSLDMKSQSEEEKHFRAALRKNGYSRQFVRCSKTDVRNLKNRDHGLDNRRKLTVTLPYIRGVSESLKRKLEEVDIKVRMKPHRTQRLILVKPKHQVSTNQQTGVVYKIPCKDCPKAYIHVSQTGRTLE